MHVSQITSDLYRLLLGRQLRTPFMRTMDSWRISLGPPALILVTISWILQAVITVVDPFDVFPWGAPHAIPQNSYSVSLGPYILNDAIRSKTPTVLIGGSTVIEISPSLLNQALHTKNALNLSYAGPGSVDSGIVMDRVARAASIKRVIMPLDVTYMFRDGVRSRDFPFYLYSSDLSDKFFAFDAIALELTFRYLTGQSFGIPSMSYRHHRREVDTQRARYLSGPMVRRATTMMEKQRNFIARPTQLACANFPALMDHVVPFARALSSRGASLDIFIPPYDMFFYYWEPVASYLNLNGGMLSNILLFRQCAVDALNPIRNVRVFAFDNEDSIVENEANFYTPGHIYNLSVYNYILSEIAHGKDRLTPRNFSQYAEELRNRVLSYRFSSLPPQGGVVDRTRTILAH